MNSGFIDITPPSKKVQTLVLVFAVGFLFCLVSMVSVIAFSALHDGVGELIKGFASIFSSGYWDSNFSSFSALSMIFGTLVVCGIAVSISLPIGLGSAIFLSEYTRGKSRALLKITVELLAAIPSVVYGLLGAMFVVPALNNFLAPIGGFGDSLFAGGLILSLMILPTIITFSDDALRCIPKEYRINALGLGLSREKVVLKLLLPMARNGLSGAVLLAAGRALGETVAVFLVIGRTDQNLNFKDFSFLSIFQSGQTLTSKLGGPELPIAYGSGLHWSSLLNLVVLLWLIVSVISFIGKKVLSREGDSA